jgi:hypothetical protein
LIIILIGLTPRARASDYEIGVDEGDVFIWNCNICDNVKLDEILGKEWDEIGFFEDIEQGTRMKWTIRDTDDDQKIYSSETKDNETTYSIEFGKWIWTTNEEWGDNDKDEDSFLFKDPDDYSEDFIFPELAPIWLPVPIGDYLKNIDLYEGYTIDARVIDSITCEIERADIDEKYPKEDVKIVALYTDQGILKSYKFYIGDHVVILDISLESFITVNFLFLSILTAFFYVGIIYVIYRLMKS